MIAATQSHTFSVPEIGPVTFQFFQVDRFGHVLKDHILNEDEPWHRLLHIREKRIENLCQQLRSGVVLEVNAAEEALYPVCVEILREGIEYAVGVPVLVEFIQERRPITGSIYRTHGYYFIGEPGFLVVVRDNVVRTAQYKVGIKRGLSRIGLFREAWLHVSSRIALATEYQDSKGDEFVRHVWVRRVSEDHWAECPV